LVLLWRLAKGFLPEFTMFVRIAYRIWQSPVLAALLFAPVGAQAQQADYDPWVGPAKAEISERLATLANECRSEMDLLLSYDPQDIIASVDFNGDGIVDPVLDQAKVSCDGSLALWAGTGGSPVRLYVSNPQGGWDEHTTGGFFGRVEIINHVPVWLQLVHGTACDGAGALPCAEVLIWGDGKFSSVADGKPSEADEPHDGA